MKRPSLKAAVEWIAYNDEPGEFDQESVDGLISVLLVADLFGVPPEMVARRVIAERYKRDGYSCGTCGANCGDKPQVVCEACRSQNE
jgi:hypothetical protein